MLKTLRRLLLAATASGLMLTAASGQSLHQSIQTALDSNPEIGQAEQNREAIEFELKQALGLFAPRIDLEATVGAQFLSNPSRRAAGIADDPLYPAQVGLSLNYDLYDGGFRQGEVDLQAARVDGASYRVLERSEFIALEVARIYFEILLQRRIIDLGRQNIAFHQFTLDNVSDAIGNGQLTEADRLQAIERLAAARARIIEAQEELNNSMASYVRYVGLQLINPSQPSRLGSTLPSSIDQALGTARLNNPLALLASADIDAAAAQVVQAESELGPKLSLRGNASTGYDLGGGSGYTHDVRGELALTWNIYDGGTRNAAMQESLRRESEALLGLHVAHRQIEEAVRLAWERMIRQREIASVYAEQLNASANLVTSYQDQFEIGDRSLLDVLDAQNTRYNLQVIQETATYSQRFAEYRLLAASGTLLDHLGVVVPVQSDAYARTQFNVPSHTDRAPATLEVVHY